MDELVALVRRSLDASTRDTFEERVDEQAAYLHSVFETDHLDNADPAIGLEVELYATDPQHRLTRLPAPCFETAPISPELGRHNAEINTAATVLSDTGIERQRTTLAAKLRRARRIADQHDRTLVLDAMWTIPPPNGSLEYLTEIREIDGVRVAANMHKNPRYCAIDNDIVRTANGQINLDLPGVTTTVPTILIESLTASIQPHLQIPDIKTFPAYFNTAIRTLGPVLALATNSPFLPADLYNDADPQRLLTDTAHELRIPVFEQSINTNSDDPKVRVPRDVDDLSAVVDRLVEDRTVAPFLKEWVDTDTDRYAESFWELDHKHGTYWRWLRPVIGGDYIDEHNTRRSLRIEYRPLPTQPTVPDVIGLQCLVAGLILGLVDADHPIKEIAWTDARDGFYNAVQSGLGAELYWITEDNEWTTTTSVIFEELFRFAKRGLNDAGISPNTVTTILDPIEARWREHTTPSQWKISRVKALTANGSSLPTAIRQMQAEYHEQSRVGTPFASWD